MLKRSSITSKLLFVLGAAFGMTTTVGVERAQADIWSGWEHLGTPSTPSGAGILETPNCVSWQARRIDCFARGADRAMWHRWFDGRAWHGWESLGGEILEVPNCVSWKTRRIDCFARGTDQAMYHRWFDGNAWRGWEHLGAPSTPSGAGVLETPNCVSWQARRIDCFARGADRAMWHRWFDGNAWRGWENLGGPEPERIILDAPNCVSWEAHRIDCFARGADQAMHHRWFDGSAWRGWENLGGPAPEGVILDAPNCVSWEAHRIDCFARGAGRVMWHRWFDRGAWLGWEYLGAPSTHSGAGIVETSILETPNCVSSEARRIDCFARGADQAMHHSSFVATHGVAGKTSVARDCSASSSKRRIASPGERIASTVLAAAGIGPCGISGFLACTSARWLCCRLRHHRRPANRRHPNLTARFSSHCRELYTAFRSARRPSRVTYVAHIASLISKKTLPTLS